MEADERRCYAGVVPFSLRCVCSRALRFTLCRVPCTFLPSCIYSEPHLSFELYLLCDFVRSASSSLPYGSYYVEPSPDFVSCLSDKSVRSRLATSHQHIPVKVIFEDRIRPDRVDGDIERETDRGCSISSEMCHAHTICTRRKSTEIREARGRVRHALSTKDASDE